jgi:hypothetical protein
LRNCLLFALALATASPVAAPEELRTLFHSPEERARLDRLRRGEPLEIPGAVRAPRAPAVTGFVKRSDGRHTVWIDGRPVNVRGPQAANVLDPRAVRAYADQGEESLKIERKPAR